MSTHTHIGNPCYICGFPLEGKAALYYIESHEVDCKGNLVSEKMMTDPNQLNNSEFETLERLFNKLSRQLGGRLCIVHSIMEGFQLAAYNSDGDRIGESIPQATIQDCVAKFKPTTKGAQG